MRIYYSLLVVDKGSWLSKFGDYDREVVQYERQRLRNRGYVTRILVTGDGEQQIISAIEKINRTIRS